MCLGLFLSVTPLLQNSGVLSEGAPGDRVFFNLSRRLRVPTELGYPLYSSRKISVVR